MILMVLLILLFKLFSSYLFFDRDPILNFDQVIGNEQIIEKSWNPLQIYKSIISPIRHR